MAVESLTWAKVIDQTRCIGCHACTTACKSENEVPLGVTRTYVKSVDIGTFPNARRAFQVTRCNQCADPPCVAACPTGAMHQRPDGIVDFDKSICIGCKACMAACPYDAIFINPDDHSAEKCNFCAHRIEVGLEPACVLVCPTQAILVGKLDDPTSKVAKLVSRQPASVRRPEKDTRPKLFYLGAHQSTLDPLAAQRPTGGIYAWAGQGPPEARVASGHPRQRNAAASSVVSYDIPHRIPWDWRVSLYTFTKGVASGVYLVAILMALIGPLSFHSQLVRFVAPLTGLGMLAATGGLLIWDLEHPERFYMLFTKHQTRSWLVRGGMAISFYGFFLLLALLAGIANSPDLEKLVAAFAIPGSIATAVYTAYLFAQAKARDLWQNPVLPLDLAVESLLAGSATCLLVALVEGHKILAHDLGIALSISAAALLTLVVGELSLTHATAHARMAGAELTHGRYAPWFWGSIVLLALSIALPWTSQLVAIAALVALLFYGHAYVQAGQSVPLA
jgi:Fe-S-cluster-containing dehydrogenase component/formate-dependent nitrite reductase membrane component NrfD